MKRITRDEAMAVLASVKDPASGRDVVSAGLIQGLVIKEGNVGFAIEIDPEEAVQKEPLRLACEQALRAAPGVISVTAVLTAHNAAPAASLRGSPAADKRAAQQHGPHHHAGTNPSSELIPDVRAVIAVASGKGGVGKSTVAVNLALGLQKLGKSVGLLDADIYGPSIPRMLALKGRPASTADGRKLIPFSACGLKAMSIGTIVDPDTPMIWRGPMVMKALTQMLTDVDWGELDILVVDMPPGTGDAQLTMAQRVPLAGAIIVSTPQEVALIDARKAYAMFEKTQVPILGIIENMSYFTVPNTGERYYIFGEGGARRTAEKLGADFLGEIPLYTSIRETSDAGTPIVASAPDSAEAAFFLAIAAQVASKLENKMRKAPPKIEIK
jgi:ATP-binding protein involved in chromosome partitioning